MKRINSSHASIFLLTWLAFGLNSCSSTQDDSVNETDTERSVEPSEVSTEAPEVCEDVNSFVPEGWKIVKKVTGDLNKDGFADATLVIQKTDASKIQKTNGGTMDTNPRTLMVLFGAGKKDCYALNMKSESFIVAHDDEYMEDPFEDIEIKNGSLKISFTNFRSMGSWETSQYAYIWRYQDGSFKLIGANESTFHRADGDARDVSVNFSTKKYSITTYNMFDEEVAEEVVWKKLDSKDLKTFESFKAPWTWKVNTDIYL